jgi:hypothetical protein
MPRRGHFEFVIRFRGDDFETWKAAFDAQEPVRVRHGAVGHWISRSIDDPNDFLGVVEFASSGGATAYAEDIHRLELEDALQIEGGPHDRRWEESVHETLDVVEYRQ